MIELHDRGVAMPLLPAADIPATIGGLARHKAEKAMYAAALAYVLGVPLDATRTALGGFRSDFETDRRAARSAAGGRA